MIPDPIERGETKADDMYHKMNIDGDHFKCLGCGEPCMWAEAQSLSPDPYGIPVCPKCIPFD